jgi:hypothetical protein
MSPRQRIPRALAARSKRENVRDGMKAWEISSMVEMRKTPPITMRPAFKGGKGRR